MSPTSTRTGSTGATVTSWRLRINGTMEPPAGRKSTVAPPATRAAIMSSMPMASACGRKAAPANGFRPWHLGCARSVLDVVHRPYGEQPRLERVGDGHDLLHVRLHV